jgi:uncharacterized protein (DUF1684 family)
MNQVNKPSNRMPLLILGGAAVLIVVWVIASRTAHEADLQQQLEQTKAELQQARSAEQLATAANDGSGAGTRTFVRPAAADHHELSNAEIDRSRDDKIRKLESSFVSEPMDAAWASTQMTSVDNAVKPAALAQFGAKAPRNLSVNCRSKQCRIEALYDNVDDAELGQFALTSGIGRGLPNAASFIIEQPDGTGRLLVFANSTPSSREHH